MYRIPLNALRSKHNDQYYAGDNFNANVSSGMKSILIRISLKFVFWRQHWTAWCRSGNHCIDLQWPRSLTSSIVTRYVIYMVKDVNPTKYQVSCSNHYCDVIMGVMASQITNLTIVYSTVHSGADQWKHQSSASLAIVRWPVNSPHKWPVTRKMFPFDNVIMGTSHGLFVTLCKEMHICVNELGHHWNSSGNGLLPIQRLPIAWINANISIGPLGTNFHEISIKIQTVLSRKCSSKCHMQTVGHFVWASL